MGEGCVRGEGGDEGREGVSAGFLFFADVEHVQAFTVVARHHTVHSEVTARVHRVEIREGEVLRHTARRVARSEVLTVEGQLLHGRGHVRREHVGHQTLHLTRHVTVLRHAHQTHRRKWQWRLRDARLCRLVGGTGSTHVHHVSCGGDGKRGSHMLRLARCLIVEVWWLRHHSGGS